MSKPKDMRAFTLVELLVVMAILAVLIALSIAGIGYALRRSRNTARHAATENMIISLEAYYTDYASYPSEQSLAAIFGPAEEEGDFILKEYSESTWDAPPSSVFYYKDDGRTDPQLYTVCVNQEVWNETVEYEWICQGTGVGSDGFPMREPAQSEECLTCAGQVGYWNGDAWE
jgi:prepilin-type N-terminal cleavage/methylation domain-containing protein